MVAFIFFYNESKNKHVHGLVHECPRDPSCLWAADTYKGCWGFDSMQQSSAAQQGQPFTACQPAQLQGAPTKSSRLTKEMTATQWLQISGWQTGTKGTTLSFLHPHLSLQQDSSCLVLLSVTPMRKCPSTVHFLTTSASLQLHPCSPSFGCSFPQWITYLHVLFH